jgi:hypothetical protein
MKISGSEDYWHQIAVHTHARLSMGSPWSVQLQLAALVGDHSIVASWAGYIPNRPSHWHVVAITDDGRLINLRMEFDAEQYDGDAEKQLSQQRQSVTVVVQEPSTHRLRDAISLQTGRAFQRPDASEDRCAIRSMSAAFGSGLSMLERSTWASTSPKCTMPTIAVGRMHSLR